MNLCKVPFLLANKFFADLCETPLNSGSQPLSTFKKSFMQLQVIYQPIGRKGLKLKGE
jgi:hypothetical protein